MADSEREAKTRRESDQPGGEQKRPRGEEEEGGPSGAEEKRPPRRLPQDRPRTPATRPAQYLDPKLVEAFDRMTVAPNETVVTPNFYALTTLDGQRIAANLQFHRYDITFEPFVPRTYRRQVIFEFNKKYFNEIPLAFDGNALCFVAADQAEATELCADKETVKEVDYEVSGGAQRTTTVRFSWTSSAKPIQPEDGTVFLQAINTCVKRALCKAFKLRVFNDALWDLKNKIDIHSPSRGGGVDTYQLVRGYNITVKPTQSGLYLNVDDTSRIFKKGTVFEWMDATRQSNREKDTYKRIIMDRLRGAVLYNTVGNELFRVSDVHFDKHPINYMFQWNRFVDGQRVEEEISIKGYYKARYNYDVKDRQPLIETMPLYRLRPNASDEEKKRYESQRNLIPGELCLFTGLDQSEKANFQLMKKINEYTKPLAIKKKIDLDNVVKKYLLNDAVKKDLAAMNMQVLTEERSEYGLSVGIRARVIVPPQMQLGGNVAPKQLEVSHTVGRNGPAISFETDVRSTTRVAVHPEEFVIAFVTTERDEATLKVFYDDYIKKAANGMQMLPVFGAFKTFYAKGMKTADFSVAVEECCNFCKEKKKVPFMFVLVPDELKERYDQVKQVSLNQFGMLSQVIRARTISKPNMSVATKVIMQVGAKMGSVLWALGAPTALALKNLMRTALIVGIDVHHDPERKGSVQVCVGTLDPRASTFYQRSRLVARGEEITSAKRTEDGGSAYAEWIRDMIRERSEKNLKTETVIVYRDGVSEGQIQMAIESEYDAISKSLAHWPTNGVGINCPYPVGQQPKIIFIFVMKRHSTRFFQWNQGGDTSTEPAERGGYGGRGGGRGGGGGEPPRKKFENPTPGTVVSRGIVRSDRAEFYLAAHDTKEGVVNPMRYEILRNETQPPEGMKPAEAEAAGYRNVDQGTIEDLTFYLTALYPNQCATISVPVVCQLAQKFAMLSGQHLHSDVVDLQTNLRKKMFYL